MVVGVLKVAVGVGFVLALKYEQASTELENLRRHSILTMVMHAFLMHACMGMHLSTALSLSHMLCTCLPVLKLACSCYASFVSDVNCSWYCCSSLVTESECMSVCFIFLKEVYQKNEAPRCRCLGGISDRHLHVLTTI